MSNRKSKYAPYEEQIRSLLTQGLEIKKINQMLAEQGVDSEYNSLHAWCRRRGLTCRSKKKDRQDKSLVGMAVAARKAGMSYGQYVAQEYCRLHPVRGGKSNAENRKK